MYEGDHGVFMMYKDVRDMQHHICYHTGPFPATLQPSTPQSSSSTTPIRATVDDPNITAEIINTYPSTNTPWHTTPTAASMALRLQLPGHAAPHEKQFCVQLHAAARKQMWQVSVQYVPQVELQRLGGGAVGDAMMGNAMGDTLAVGTVTLHVGRPGTLCRCFVSDAAVQVCVFAGACVGVCIYSTPLRTTPTGDPGRVLLHSS